MSIAKTRLYPAYTEANAQPFDGVSVRRYVHSIICVAARARAVSPDYYILSDIRSVYAISDPKIFDEPVSGMCPDRGHCSFGLVHFLMLIL
jgi:hypothetical protein